ncbi:MAG: DegT/DnrJ/EryC1/StrS family aminotransferase [Selenomonas ruminantium]|uniref:DegT/DnrJ/EryC1/StrS family aminotransferase n=1 Tax=Selenomonas ruminantium TaxID=971 RepID=A0A927ZTM4_SELRU|nr:DegT/DnrJ/EryC1/StrS family aminotransferase [Selenomonas ruminantium]
MNSEFIAQMEPSYDEHEIHAMEAYLRSGGWLTEFRKTREFEDMIACYTGAKHCSIMPNGTLSLAVALLACDVQPGDEVICPDYTMAATPNAAELIGATAVFVDIDRTTLCMDFEKMRQAFTPRTRAVLFVSINGRCPRNIQVYADFCRERGVHFLEDAAQSLGSVCNGRHLGLYGEIGSFSFSMPKIITTGQGGALITNDDSLMDKIKRIRDFGRDKGGSDHYMVKGWNFKFTDVQAVIGIEQMKKLSDRVKRKKEMAELYRQGLSNIRGVELVPTDLEETAPWFFDILCENREELQSFLKENQIGSRPFYPPLHAEPAYSYEGDYPVTEEISRKGLWLPSSIKLTDEQIEHVCIKVREFYS